MFHLLLPFAIVASGSALVVEGTTCTTCIIVNATCYNVSKVVDLDAPFRDKVVIHKIGVQRSKNRLYFSFEPVFEDPEYYKVGFVDLDAQNISGIINAQDLILNFGTFDFDQDNELVYFGGSDGVFILDTKSNSLSPYSSRGDTIRDIFYKNYVYFSKYNDLGVVSKKGDAFRTLFEYIPIESFVITKYDVIVFHNRYGLHVAKGDLVFRLSKIAFFRGITKDLDDNVYAWWIDGIYKVLIDKKDLYYSKLVKLVDVEFIGAMTFDNDNNIMFTVDNGLFRMTTSESGCGIIPS